MNKALREIVIIPFSFKVPVVYNGEEMMGDENEGMVAIRMIDDDDEDGPHQVRISNCKWASVVFHAATKNVITEKYFTVEH